MADEADHNRIIAAAAKDALAPLGMRRKGRSRTWLDDGGWRLGIVEFQPSQWDRGTYLNVGLMFLWRPTDHLTFEVGNRVEDFKSANDSDFFLDAQHKAAVGAQRIRELRTQFASTDDVIRQLSDWPRSLNLYEQAHLGTAFGLRGEMAQCQAAFDRALDLREDSRSGIWNAAAWMLTARAAAEDADRFRAWVSETIGATRSALKLTGNFTMPTA